MLAAQKNGTICHSPGNHDDEVHHVPNVPQVRASVQHETQGEDLERRLHAEDAQEIWLRFFLFFS